MECIKFFFFKKQNRRVEFNPEIQWRMAAERSEAVASGLSFSLVWTPADSNRSPPECKTGALPDELGAPHPEMGLVRLAVILCFNAVYACACFLSMCSRTLASDRARYDS